ncbi:ATP-binding cassette domain-containing protein [Hankyongella ginsenosidimutans]|uniref:ATP-binding cassette domain-containing protein n=1 Tax=Hankyongella ginsenosidimutans TaxID=1763828 RepID=UPI001CA354D1|nr:ATP-binding cassette domain-containing protein [Hankyongella ginsenosidimutans]
MPAGANGAGKTTTINLFLGFTAPSEGEALVAGQPVVQDPAAARALLGYVAEIVALYPSLTGAENLAFSPDWRDTMWTLPAVMRSLRGCAFRRERSTARPAAIPRGCARSSASPSR